MPEVCNTIYAATCGAFDKATRAATDTATRDTVINHTSAQIDNSRASSLLFAGVFATINNSIERFKCVRSSR